MDKQKARFRIDGAVALAMAVGVKAIGKSKPEPSYLESGAMMVVY
jgi:hypothetical protein